MTHKSSTKSDLDRKLNSELTPEQQEEQVREIAYYLWKKKGEKHGEDRDDWFATEASFHEDYTD